jgi:hypothetical protein
MSYYPDRVLDPRVSEELSQQNNWEALVAIGYLPLADSKLAKKLRNSVQVKGVTNGIDGSFVMTPAAKAAFDATYYLSKWIQLTSPGFLPNTRQHRMFGISALQFAQTMRFHCLLKIAYGENGGSYARNTVRRLGAGMVFPDAASSDRKFDNDYSFLLETEGSTYRANYAVIENGIKSVLPATLDGSYYDENLVINMGEDDGSFFVPTHYHSLCWRDLAVRVYVLRILFSHFIIYIEL